MTYFIKVRRIPYEEPYHVELHWHVSNGNTETRFMYYHNADSLKEIGEALKIFPRHNTDVFRFEHGSERAEDRFAYYFRFRTFVVDATGSAVGIQIRFNNNQDLPDRELTEFCITTDSATMNRLGKLFSRFHRLEDEVFYWSIKEEFIGTSEELNLEIWRDDFA